MAFNAFQQVPVNTERTASQKDGNRSVTSTSFDTELDLEQLQLYPLHAVSFNFSTIPLDQPTVPVQPKLTVNSPGDAYEQEADAMADKVMGMRDSDVPRAHVSTSPIIQRKCTHCEEEEEGKLQRKETNNAVPVVSDAVNQTLQSSGKPLDKTTRSFMEQRFGFDFGRVRVHDDAKAHQSARDINALAYTQRNDIVFGAGHYRPKTESGKKLLAHELVHVIQQTNNIRRKIIDLTDKFVDDPETEALRTEPGTTPSQTGPNPDDQAIVAEFAANNKGLGKRNLTKWIKQSIENGWQPGMPIPNFKKPSISFNGEGELVIESVSFRGVNGGAFHAAAQILPKNVGAKFWWKKRFTESIGEYKLDYSSNKAYKNLQLHEKARDVDFEALLKVSEDLSDYREIMAIKTYSGKLLSEALVRMIAIAQQKIYPHDLERQTGILDRQTADDIKSKIAADKSAEAETAEKEKAAAEKKENPPQLPDPPATGVFQAKIDALKKEIAAPVPMTVEMADIVINLDLKFLYRISQRFTLGFYQYLNTLPIEEINKKFRHLLLVQYSSGYLWGQVKGVLLGIGSWIKDTVGMIWEIIKLPYTISKLFFVTIPDALASVYEDAKRAVAWLEGNQQIVLKFVNELARGGGSDISAIEDAIKEKIYSMAEDYGRSASSSLMDFAGKSDEEIGIAMGKVQGYILPDILLFIFSQGMGNAIKAGMKSIQIFIEAGRAGTIALKALEAGKAGVAILEKFLESGKIFANKVYGELKIMLRNIIDYVKKLLGFEEKAFETARTAEHVVEEAKVFSKLEGEADEVLKKDAKKHADDVVEDGLDKRSKSGTLFKAIIITEVADAKNLPVTALLTELKLLTVSNPKVSFYSEGIDPYKIWMKGSKYLVDGHYTVKGGGPRKPREPFADDPDFKDAIAAEEHAPGVDRPHSSASTSDLDNLESKRSSPHKKALYSADLGVAEGKAAAKQDGLTWLYDNPRGMDHNVPGMDSIYRDANGNLFIIEFKGGGAQLQKGQMKRSWVDRKITEIENSPVLKDHPFVKELRDAFNNNKLRGKTYFTPADGVTGEVGKTIMLDHGVF